jgi:hypothetical protein
MWPAEKFCVINSVIRLGVPQPTEWQRIGNQIDAAMIFTGPDFVGVHGNAQQLASARCFRASWLAGLLVFGTTCQLVVEPRKYGPANQCVEERIYQSYDAADWRNRITSIQLAYKCGFPRGSIKWFDPPRKKK